MSVAVIGKLVILGAYLAGLGLGDGFDTVAAGAALAVLVVWAAMLLRKRYARPATAAVAGTYSGAGRPK